jgi:arylsulfatase
LAGLQDILPTLCGLVGEPLEAEVDGKDLTPALLRNEKVRDYYVSQCNIADPGRAETQIYMITDGLWKYIYTVYGGIEELYQLDEDPGELHNLAAGCQKKTEELRQRIWQWCVENQDLEMLDGSQLLKIERISSETKLPANPFGRRYY